MNPLEFSMHERRVRIYSLPAHTVLDHFSAAGANFTHLSLPRLDLPNGYSVRSVTADWFRNTIDFQVEHPTFDPVPDGAPAPPFGLCGLQWEVVKVVRPPSPADTLFGFPTEVEGEQVVLMDGD